MMTYLLLVIFGIVDLLILALGLIKTKEPVLLSALTLKVALDVLVAISLLGAC